MPTKFAPNAILWSSGNGVICYSFCHYVDCTSAEKNGATNPAYGMSDTDWCGYSSWSGKTAVIGVEVFFPVKVAMPRESPPSPPRNPPPNLLMPAQPS